MGGWQVSWYLAIVTPRLSQAGRGGDVSTETERDRPKPHKFHIQIDRVHFTVTQEHMTGAELRALPSPPIGPDRDLFEVVPGDPDRKVELDTVVKMRDGKRFFTAPAQINPGC
jgi:hypothetical protein